MSKKKVMVTLFKGGTKEKTLPINEVHIPDLWHIAQRVRKGTYMDPARRKEDCAKIIETWHIAAWLKEHIREHEGTPKKETKRKPVRCPHRHTTKEHPGCFHGGR